MASLIDEQIEEALRKGQLHHLPGEGKPLKLENDAHVPETLRMAHKLMRDNNVLPDWIEESKGIDRTRADLLARITRAAHSHRGALNDAARSGTPEQARQRVEQHWRETVTGLRDSAKRLNSQILTYNLKVPPGVVHKPHLDFEAELKRADAR